MTKIRNTVRTVVIAVSIPAISFMAIGSLSAADRAPDTSIRALVKAAAQQFQLSYRMRPAEGENRQEQLSAVVAAWRAAPRSEANNERMTKWLRGAIRASMPGSHEPLPPIPNFAGEPQSPHVTDPPLVAPPESAPTIGPTTRSPERPQSTDPFRDDPIDTHDAN